MAAAATRTSAASRSSRFRTVSFAGESFSASCTATSGSPPATSVRTAGAAEARGGGAAEGRAGRMVGAGGDRRRAVPGVARREADRQEARRRRGPPRRPGGGEPAGVGRPAGPPLEGLGDALQLAQRLL